LVYGDVQAPAIMSMLYQFNVMHLEAHFVSSQPKNNIAAAQLCQLRLQHRHGYMYWFICTELPVDWMFSGVWFFKGYQKGSVLVFVVSGPPVKSM
jgi:hypothetical protein